MRVKKRHRLAAESTRYLSLIVSGARPRVVKERYLAKFKALGYTIVYKDSPGFSRTLKHRLFLTERWDRMETMDQAALLAHEYVHARQWRGYRMFLVRYALSKWFRWAVECQGYREHIRAWRAMGVPEDKLEAYAASRDWGGYAFSKRMRKAIDGPTGRILLLP